MSAASRDIAARSVRRQAEAYLAVEAAKQRLHDAEAELAAAQRDRLRPLDPLTVVIGDQAITSHRTNPDAWRYVISKVLS